MATLIHIIIVNYNSCEDTIECIQSILDSQGENYRIYVVDNNSKREFINPLQTWIESLVDHEILDANLLDNSLPQSKCNLIKLSENLGFAGANNVILKKIPIAFNQLVWLLNPDMTISKETTKFLEASIRGKYITATKTYSYYHKSKLLHQGTCTINKYFGTINFQQEGENEDVADYINGGSLFFPSSAIEELGLLPENYFLYWEETYWCAKALQSGWKINANKSAQVWDKGSSTIGKGKIAEYYYTRNSLLFFKEFYPKTVNITLCFQVLRFFYRVLLLKLERANGIYLGIYDYLKNKSGKLI